MKGSGEGGGSGDLKIEGSFGKLIGERSAVVFFEDEAVSTDLTLKKLSDELLVTGDVMFYSLVFLSYPKSFFQPFSYFFSFFIPPFV